jgi:hypothetical protein
MTERNHIILIGMSECAIHFESDIRQRHVFPFFPPTYTPSLIPPSNTTCPEWLSDAGPCIC